MKKIYFVLLLLTSCVSGDIITPDLRSFVSEWRVERVLNDEVDVTEDFDRYRIIFESAGSYILFTKNNENIWVQRKGNYRIPQEETNIFLSEDPDLENYVVDNFRLTFFQIQNTGEGQKKLFFALVKR